MGSQAFLIDQCGVVIVLIRIILYLNNNLHYKFILQKVYMLRVGVLENEENVIWTYNI